MREEQSYHDPVLARECLEWLAVRPDGVYVDATFGGGGHARLMLNGLGPEGKLLAFDQDEDAKANVPDDQRMIFVESNFRFLRQFVRLQGFRQVDGILADLGVSSHQLDEANRGFSYRFAAELDMRMNQRDGMTAADVLNTYPADRLQEVLGEFGEVRNARTLAQAIDADREKRPFRTIDDLLQTMGPLVRGQELRYRSQVFQALRMEVNDEVGALKDFLTDALSVLKPGGRLVVIAYHSIEDRIVKHFLKTGNAAGEEERDFYGNITRPFKILTKKAQLPTEAEIKRNPRARSAKLRVGEKQ